LIEVGEHLGRILAATPLFPAETVPLAAARGLCLAEPATARVPVPPWTNSAMDGYAVRFDDVQAAGDGGAVRLRVVADLPAGTSLRPRVGPGEAARIMTGAPVPPGSDAVVPVELTDGGTGTVTVTSSPGEKRHIRHAGEDREPGDPVAESGVKITAELISSLASSGYGEVAVRRRPRIAVIATGDELVEPGTELAYGQIPDSNSLLVAGLAGEADTEVTSVSRCGDAEGDLERAVAACAGKADLIIMTGGVSVGAFDPVKALFEGGDEVRFDRVAMQPGKPQAFGKLGSGPLVFGLPGNPVSVWVSFHVFVRPCLRAMQGYSGVTARPVPARVTAGWRGTGARTQYLPAVITSRGGGRTVAPAARGGSGSHLVASLARANGYAIVPAGEGPVAAGDTVATVRTTFEAGEVPEGGESGA